MSFEDWQNDRICARLNDYREERASGMPITKLFAQLKECPENKKFFKKGKGQFLYEVFRRLVSDGKIPEDHKMDAVKNFLIYKGFLTEEELQDLDGDHGEARGVHQFMANGPAKARESLAKIHDGYYVTIPDMSTPDETIELKFTVDSGKAIIAVEEHTYKTEWRVRRGINQRVPNGMSKMIRKGYGFLATKKNLLHIFVCGGDTSDRIHYVELAVNFLKNSSPYLVRVGEGKGHSLGLIEQTLADIGIYRFQNDRFKDEEIEDFRQIIYQLGFVDIEGRQASLLIQGIKRRDFMWTQAVLQEGANPNVRDEQGMTALQHAVVRGFRSGIRLLIESKKCDFTKNDLQGRSPACLAIEWSRDYALARLLRRKRERQISGIDPMPQAR
ncbi:ankyrin repeat domain-containing protein [Undibacterium sp. Di26W]|uniref:ankyrin repeat domain-containing protein n=1 Tax=Undibacterium sp. Di26W TaxID=3413035 RepID=UPI003BF25F2B